jgi:hypothetical protein
MGEGCDVAVLDVNLGDVTSERVADELKRRGTPFVGLFERSASRRDQGYAVFSKPVRIVQIIAALRALAPGG